MQAGCRRRQICTDPNILATLPKLWAHAHTSIRRQYSSPTRSLHRPRQSSSRCLVSDARNEHVTLFSTSATQLLRYRPDSGKLYQPRFRTKKQTSSINGGDVSRRGNRQDYKRWYDMRPGPEKAERWTPATRRNNDYEYFTNDPDTLASASHNLVESPLEQASSNAPRLSRKQQSLEELEAELQWQARHNPHPVSVRTILTLLIRKHNVVPSQRHYEALLLSNCSPDGSAEYVREILAEMEVAGMDLSTSVLTAALHALAVHPQSTLAADILALLSQSWSFMPSELQHCLVISAIRTHQPELANALLNNIHTSQKSLALTDRTPVPLYLYIMFMQYLVTSKDYDAVIRLIYKLRDRNAVDMDLPPMLWSWVLEKSARDGDEWVSTWIWREWVQRMTVRPSRETCHHMLQIASRDAQSKLAESVRDSILYGGVDPSSVKQGKDKLPMDELTAYERNMVHESYRHDGGVNQFDHEEGVHHDDEASRSHYVRSGNMWRYFKRTSDHGIGRCDPWDALGPRSRRR